MKQIKTVILTIAAALTLSSCNYNGMVEREEAVSQAWSNVENQYQRRADLIPNLVNTVKGYAAHEQETLAQVIEARSKATSINIDAESLTPETLQAYQKAQGEIGSALGRLIAKLLIFLSNLDIKFHKDSLCASLTVWLKYSL